METYSSFSTTANVHDTKDISNSGTVHLLLLNRPCYRNASPQGCTHINMWSGSKILLTSKNPCAESSQGHGWSIQPRYHTKKQAWHSYSIIQRNSCLLVKERRIGITNGLWLATIYHRYYLPYTTYFHKLVSPLALQLHLNILIDKFETCHYYIPKDRQWCLNTILHAVDIVFKNLDRIQKHEGILLSILWIPIAINRVNTWTISLSFSCCKNIIKSGNTLFITNNWFQRHVYHVVENGTFLFNHTAIQICSF